MTVCLVTGANKGIGFAIVKNLCQSFKGHIILAARSESRGKQAIAQLEKEEGVEPGRVSFLPLDIDDEKSIHAAARAVEKAGGLDILINNAGMAFKGNAFDENVAKTTIHTNYIGTKLMCQEFIPLLRKNGRIVNVSSMAANSALRKCSKELQDKFLQQNLTLADLDTLLTSFVDSVKRRAWKEEGWPSSCYGISKVGVSMLTRILAANNKGLSINACCPGWVRTDMAGPNAPKSPEEGAITPVFLALSPAATVGTGGMWSDKKNIGWGV